MLPEHIDKIYDAHMNKSEIKHFSHIVTTSDIEEENYNLSVSTYVEQEQNKEIVDIVKLNNKISEIVAHEQQLRSEIDEIINELEGVVA